MYVQTYKTSSDATGATCVPNDTTRNKLLIAGIVLACVLLLAILLAIIVFWRWDLRCPCLYITEFLLGILTQCTLLPLFNKE